MTMINKKILDIKKINEKIITKLNKKTKWNKMLRDEIKKSTSKSLESKTSKIKKQW